MYLFLKRSGKRLLKSPQLLACSAWGASAGLGCHLGSTCSGLGQIPGGHKQIWTCKEHWWRRKPFQIRWRRVLQRSSGRLVSALHNLTNLRLCSHLVPEHWYKIVWHLVRILQVSKYHQVPEYKVETLHPGTEIFPLFWCENLEKGVFTLALSENGTQAPCSDTKYEHSPIWFANMEPKYSFGSSKVTMYLLCFYNVFLFVL